MGEKEGRGKALFWDRRLTRGMDSSCRAFPSHPLDLCSTVLIFLGHLFTQRPRIMDFFGNRIPYHYNRSFKEFYDLAARNWDIKAKTGHVVLKGHTLFLLPCGLLPPFPDSHSPYRPFIIILSNYKHIFTSLMCRK